MLIQQRPARFCALFKVISKEQRNVDRKQISWMNTNQRVECGWLSKSQSNKGQLNRSATSYYDLQLFTDWLANFLFTCNCSYAIRSALVLVTMEISFLKKSAFIKDLNPVNWSPQRSLHTQTDVAVHINSSLWIMGVSQHFVYGMSVSYFTT